MIDVVLRVQSVGPRWLVELRGARARVEPLVDSDLKSIEGLPPFAQTWRELLARLGAPDSHPAPLWQPDRRILEALGRLLRQRLIVGDVANQVAVDEQRAAAEGRPLRYLVHVFEGEEAGLLPRLPFELLHDDSFWFRREAAVGLRRVPKGGEVDVHLRQGATALVAWAALPNRQPDEHALRAHAAEIAATLTSVGLVPRVANSCTPTTLRDEVRRGCELLYIVCHGTEDWDHFGRLELEGGTVTGSDLGEWIEAGNHGRPRMQVAMLCACSSASPGHAEGTLGLAQHLASGDRRAVAALGFRAPVRVGWALEFMNRVIAGLAGGALLEEAVSKARREEPVDDPAWALPLLFGRERRPVAVAVEMGSFRTDSAPPPMLLPPPPRDYFVAREPELAALDAWLVQPGRAVAVLAGEGGIGKSELARSFAHRVAGNAQAVLWLEQPDRSVSEALGAMVRVLAPGYRPEATDTQDDLRARMNRALGDQAGLLVLDDLEDGACIEALTPGDRWKVLVTARDRGVVPGVEPMDVAPLDLESALRLLARLAYAGDSVPANGDDGSRGLVEALGHQPLAIEVASALIRKGETPDEVLAGLARPDGAVHAAIGRVIERSVRALDPDDRMAWYTLAVMPSAPVGARALAAACGVTHGVAARRLSRLRDASLVRADAAEDVMLHPVARQIARAWAKGDGSWDAVHASVARGLAALTAWGVAPMGTDSGEAWRRWRELRPLVDALDAADWPPGVDGADEIAAVLAVADGFRSRERLIADRHHYLEDALARAVTPPTVANAHRARGALRVRRADLTGAEADYARALALYAAVEDNLGLASAHKARGDLRVRRDDLTGAEADYARALELYAAVEDNLGLANAHRARGTLRVRRDDLTGAEADYARALELYATVENNLGLANAHLARGALRVRRADLTGAEADYARALELYAAVENNLGLANAHRARGDLRVRRDDLTGAEVDYARALELHAAVEDNLGLANAHQARGTLRVRRADLTGAEADYARALELYAAVEDNLGLANAHLARGDLRVRRDDLTGAEADYARALELYAAVEDNLGLANAHKARGDLRVRRDDLTGAEADYARALELYAAVENNLGLANAHRARGALRVRRADLTGAEADYAHALELYAAVENNLGLANAHRARGTLRVRRDDLTGAEADYARALELYATAENNLGLASAHKARGALRVRRDDLTGAEADYARALELYAAVEDNLGLASAHKARGDLRVRRDDLTGAEADYARALELYAAVEDNLGLANAHRARGALRVRRDDLTGAEADYARALELYAAVEDNLGLANAHKARGDLRVRRDDLTGAEADYARALELYAAVENNLGLANAHRARGTLRVRRADLTGAEADYARALELYAAVENNLGLANAHRARGALRVRRDDLTGAEADYARALELYAAVENNLGLMPVLPLSATWRR